ncbi:MAG: Abi family protein [Burkholderiales bacterium]|jgi:abortive infection bacteriophage resistance protein|nr:Abi family protein [Burkholderiales bacterium]
MKPLKPWLSFVNQLQQLQARGLQVDDPVAALDYLERLGYYRLSGYWYPLRLIDQEASKARGKAVRLDSFASGSRFKDVVRLYVFDKKLRLLALDALERVEMAVRVDVAHLLGKRDPRAHENPMCLHGNFTKKLISSGPDKGKTQHQVWLAKYQSLLLRVRKEPFVAHHLQQYDGLPIWAAIEVWDFGLLSKLFAGMQYADQQSIAALYGAPDGRAFAMAAQPELHP